jgi:hypothetical protein
MISDSHYRETFVVLIIETLPLVESPFADRSPPQGLPTLLYRWIKKKHQATG